MKIDSIQEIARRAGSEILALYNQPPEVEQKADQSPLTRADRASHALIERALADLDPSIPIVSEEGAIPDASALNGRFWLVDPLDGTKEFLKKTGDFTVNIALIEEAKPILGVVFAPAKELMYYASSHDGAWRKEDGKEPQAIQVRDANPHHLWVVASKDHAGPEVAKMLERIPNAQLTSMGSSLKFCLVAEGCADIYPRFVPTMEWDTAAAHCVVNEAGGVVTYLDGEPLVYGKAEFRNPSIVTCGDPNLAWQEWIK